MSIICFIWAKFSEAMTSYEDSLLRARRFQLFGSLIQRQEICCTVGLMPMADHTGR